MKRGISVRILLLVVFFCVFSISGFVKNASAVDSAGVEDFVTRFYQLCLDRNPDSAGLDGWVSTLLAGTLTGSDVAYGFRYMYPSGCPNSIHKPPRSSGMRI